MKNNIFWYILIIKNKNFSKIIKKMFFLETILIAKNSNFL